MNPYELLEQRISSAQTLDESARVLSELLNGGYSIWTDGSLYHIRQQVGRKDALQIHVYANEHPPPHFHVQSADVDAVFTIDDCTYIKGNIDGREQRLVKWWYGRNRELLIKTWNATRPAGCPVGPIED
jgi:Domain of unknown function (DUF4160)